MKKEVCFTGGGAPTARAVFVFCLAMMMVSGALWAEAPFRIKLDVAPNSQGQLEGAAEAELDWLWVLTSGALYKDQTLLQVEPFSGGEQTTTIHRKTWGANLLGLRDTAIAGWLGSSFSFVRLGVGLTLKMVQEDISRFGYTSTYMFNGKEERLSWTPLLNYKAGLDFGFVSLGYYGETTPYYSFDNLSGNYRSTEGGSTVKTFSNQTTGFETLHSGYLKLVSNQWFRLNADFSWLHKLAYSDYWSTGAFTRYVFYLDEYTLGASMQLVFLKDILKVMEQIPSVGVSWTTTVFTPAIKISGSTMPPGFTNSRINLLFGISL